MSFKKIVDVYNHATQKLKINDVYIKDIDRLELECIVAYLHERALKAERPKNYILILNLISLTILIGLNTWLLFHKSL